MLDDDAAGGCSAEILSRSKRRRARVLGPAWRARANDVNADICDMLGMQMIARAKPSSAREESRFVSNQLDNSGLDVWTCKRSESKTTCIM